MCQNIETDSDFYPDAETPKRKESYLRTQKPPGRNPRSAGLPPVTLPNTRIGGRGPQQPPAAHPQAKNPAAAAQAQHPNTTIGPESQTNSLRLQTGNLE